MSVLLPEDILIELAKYLREQGWQKSLLSFASTSKHYHNFFMPLYCEEMRINQGQKVGMPRNVYPKKLTISNVKVGNEVEKFFRLEHLVIEAIIDISFWTPTVNDTSYWTNFVEANPTVNQLTIIRSCRWREVVNFLSKFHHQLSRICIKEVYMDSVLQRDFLSLKFPQIIFENLITQDRGMDIFSMPNASFRKLKVDFSLNLEILDRQPNIISIDSKYVKGIPQSVHHSLQHLDISRNSPQDILNLITYTPNLRRLVIKYNDEILDIAPQIFTSLKYLTFFDAKNNLLVNKSDYTIVHVPYHDESSGSELCTIYDLLPNAESLELSSIEQLPSSPYNELLHLTVGNIKSLEHSNFVKTFPNLESLTINKYVANDNKSITNADFIITLIMFSPNLKSLYVNNTRVTEHMYTYIRAKMNDVSFIQEYDNYNIDLEFFKKLLDHEKAVAEDPRHFLFWVGHYNMTMDLIAQRLECDIRPHKRVKYSEA